MLKINLSFSSGKIILSVSLLAAILALGACGKKASRLDPPAPYDRKHDPFPAAYPDPATDPAP